MNNQVSNLSRYLLIGAAFSLVISIFTPIWRIDLDAPQYPEGLRLLIYANKLGGDVEIVNGLNHYIGMKTLHSEDFIEFTLLPYLIGFFAAASFFVAFKRSKKLLYALLVLFLVFGIVSMIDFWRWEYDYGHNLDPNAAIVVPGMAYQPPLIGFKQLLNFGAYSIPDIGGWLFILAGLLMLAASYIEFKGGKKISQTVINLSFPLGLLFLASCGQPGPEPINVNKDVCQHCKMNISDTRFAAELITPKGRIYKFDDILCMAAFDNNQPEKGGIMYICDYGNPGTLVSIDSVSFLKGEAIQSPMRGNVAAFASDEDMNEYNIAWQAKPIGKAELFVALSK
ncbi:MAG: nitrous oxide reductase accessory protein NosL [Saprospiraceae bacterium]|nr:nitrous oxide reductase accessory protein NosL [Saprospiraceae bacterium]